jgi:hypothetical protein
LLNGKSKLTSCACNGIKTEHRKTGPLLRTQHSTLVGYSSRRRRRRQLFRCCFYNNQTKPKKQQILNNNTATALFVFIYWLPCLGSSARLAAQYQ